MRERVSLAIDKRDLKILKNENLMRQSTLVHNALITTIDSFCLFCCTESFFRDKSRPGFSDRRKW